MPEGNILSSTLKVFFSSLEFLFCIPNSLFFLSRFGDINTFFLIKKKAINLFRIREKPSIDDEVVQHMHDENPRLIFIVKILVISLFWKRRKYFNHTQGDNIN